MTRRTIVLSLLCLGLFAVPSASAEEISIGGRVVLPWGGPLAEAEVRLIPLQAPMARMWALLDEPVGEPAARALTDGEGHFRLLAPHAGLWTLRVEATGFAPLELDLKPLIETVELPDAEMATDSSLTVTVTDPSRKPLVGARVLVRGERSRFQFFGGSGWRAPLRSAVTGPDGKVIFPRGESERVIVSASFPGLASTERRGLSGSAARLQLAPGSSRRIEARAASGEPIPGVMVAVGERLHPLGITDEEGRFTLVLAGSEPTEARLLAPDGRWLETRLQPSSFPDDGPKTLVLEERLAVSGRLIDAESRRAIAGGVVWDSTNPVEGFVTDEAGGFVLTGSAGSRLSINAGAAGYLRDRGVEFQLTGDGRPGPTLPLHPAAAIEGKIVDAEGTPVSGADVRLKVKRAASGSMQFDFGGQTTAPRAVSGPAGAFRLSPVDPDKSYIVKVQAESFAPADAEVAGLEPYRTQSGVRVELERGKGLGGTVIDASELPLRDVQITMKPQQSPGGMGMMRIMDSDAVPLEFLGSTDGEGRFRIVGLPAGKFDLEAYRPGFARTTVQGIEIPEDAPLDDLEPITLEPGERVQGLVMDNTGLPLEGVEVSISTGGPQMMLMMGGGNPDEPQPDAVTDPNGWFAVDDLAASETYSFSFSRGGFVTGNAKAIELPRLEPLEIRLEPASDVSGIVLDREGEPIAGASVSLRRSKTIEMGGSIMQTVMMMSETSQSDGTFLFADQEPGSVALSAVASGYQEAKLDNIEIPKGEDVLGVELPLPNGAILEGRVLTPDGRPAIGAEVREVKEETGMVRFGGQRTDGNGYYRVEGLAPGPISIEAVHEDYPRAVRDVEVDEGIHSVDLQLAGGFEVTGRVTSIAGDPIVDASVGLHPAGREWGGPETRTKGDGTFTMPGVQDGDYTLWANANDYAPLMDDRQVQVDGEPYYDLEVRLDVGVTAAGQVTGIDPAKFGKVTVRAEGGGFHGWNSSSLDSQGKYEIEHLGPGTYDIVAQLVDSGREAKEQVILDAGAEQVTTDLHFDKGLTLTGRALEAELPVVGAMVIVEGIDVDRDGWGQTGEQGGFVVDGLEKGRYRLKLRDWQTGLAHNEMIDLGTDREILIEVPAASVAGLLIDSAERRPLAGVALTLEPENEELRGRVPSHTATTDLEGRFKIANVGDGAWRLSAVKRGYAAISQAVAVKHERGADDLKLSMDPTEGMTLETRLPSGTPPDEIRVAVIDPAGAALVTGVYATGENGRVRLSTVPAGSWDLVVSAAGSATANLQANAPGAAIPIALQPATGLKITVPELQATDLVATVHVKDDRGVPFRSLEWSGRPVVEFRMYGGQIELSSLPPGNWSVVVAAGDRSWQGQSTTAGGGTSELVLD